MHPSDPKIIVLAAELPHTESEAAIEEAALESKPKPESEPKPEPHTEIGEAESEAETKSETIETLTLHDPYLKASYPLVREALLKQSDVLQLANGDIVIYAEQITQSFLTWDAEDKKFMRITLPRE